MGADFPTLGMVETSAFSFAVNRGNSDIRSSFRENASEQKGEMAVFVHFLTVFDLFRTFSTPHQRCVARSRRSY